MEMKKRAGFCFVLTIWMVSVCLWVSSEKVEGGDNILEEKVVKEIKGDAYIKENDV